MVHQSGEALAGAKLPVAVGVGEDTPRAGRDSLPVELARAERFETFFEDSEQSTISLPDQTNQIAGCRLRHRN